ncbi:VOC domain-containing protein, variant 2 [Balamuthia mandrillaris]
MTEPAGATFAAEGCSSVLGITSFNHVTKEVCDLEASRRFYCDVLGFQQVRRPAFKIDGIWLHGHNLGLHLLCPTDNHKRRTKRTQQKKEYHQSSVPVCDHMAFTVLNMEQVESFLQSKKMEYTKVCTLLSFSSLFGVLIQNKKGG